MVIFLIYSQAEYQSTNRKVYFAWNCCLKFRIGGTLNEKMQVLEISGLQRLYAEQGITERVEVSWMAAE